MTISTIRNGSLGVVLLIVLYLIYAAIWTFWPDVLDRYLGPRLAVIEISSRPYVMAGDNGILYAFGSVDETNVRGVDLTFRLSYRDPLPFPRVLRPFIPEVPPIHLVAAELEMEAHDAKAYSGAWPPAPTENAMKRKVRDEQYRFHTRLSQDETRRRAVWYKRSEKAPHEGTFVYTEELPIGLDNNILPRASAYFSEPWSAADTMDRIFSGVFYADTRSPASHEFWVTFKYRIDYGGKILELATRTKRYRVTYSLDSENIHEVKSGKTESTTPTSEIKDQNIKEYWKEYVGSICPKLRESFGPDDQLDRIIADLTRRPVDQCDGPGVSWPPPPSSKLLPNWNPLEDYLPGIFINPPPVFAVPRERDKLPDT